MPQMHRLNTNKKDSPFAQANKKICESVATPFASANQFVLCGNSHLRKQIKSVAPICISKLNLCSVATTPFA